MGRFEEFDAFIRQSLKFDPMKAGSPAVRLLWNLRDALGRVFGIGRIARPSGEDALPSPLFDRLPDELKGSAGTIAFSALPFHALFKTDDEFAAEISNATMHGIMHLVWIACGEDAYRARMAVYVRPNGLLGRAYMAAIKPFRYALVYPALLKEIGLAWTRRPRIAQ